MDYDSRLLMILWPNTYNYHAYFAIFDLDHVSIRVRDSRNHCQHIRINQFESLCLLRKLDLQLPATTTQVWGEPIAEPMQGRVNGRVMIG